MSVLIRGMKMPTSCADCPIGDAICCPLIPGVPAWWVEYNNAVREKRMHSNCPLVPIPPHGDLIDRNALTISTAVPLDGKSYQYVHIDNIKGASVIIPANRPKEENHGRKV